ncbi:hypothetical protein PIB30_077347 [Stylosanthes scabra]|uniref:Uncharacterized protein n=1 Tax=Stylosanthes scabra TaxID=79078 RepID=A0ABU6SQL9_9FABA|nr:hypothetical protein [Stylosanthes scabra]
MGGEASSSFESKMNPPSIVSCASDPCASSYGWLSELRCEYFVWVDEVHEHEMERVPEEKKMSQHKFSWEDSAKVSDGGLKEDANYVLLFNTISRMKCEISALKKISEVVKQKM